MKCLIKVRIPPQPNTSDKYTLVFYLPHWQITKVEVTPLVSCPDDMVLSIKQGKRVLFVTSSKRKLKDKRVSTIRTKDFKLNDLYNRFVLGVSNGFPDKEVRIEVTFTYTLGSFINPTTNKPKGESPDA